MSITEPGLAPLPPHAAESEGDFPQELWALLQTISHQIDESDQRHTGLLQELRDRLAALGRDANDARGTAAAAAAPIYDRIENGLADLADRIGALDEADQSPSLPLSAPVALRSASGSVGSSLDDRAVPTGIDPFDIVGGDDDDRPGWDPADAEALTRIYEESDAALVRKSPRSDAPSDAPSDAHALGEPTSMRAAPAAASADLCALPAVVHADAVPGLDQTWLDRRLSEIALRIEQSLESLRADSGVDGFGSRFDAFEERMSSVIGDVATRSDVESLKVLEGQIQELAAHLEQTELQLGRLDGIEQQLEAVIEHLASEVPNVQRAVPEAAHGLDLKSLAATAAEEVAQRLAGSMNVPGPGGDVRIDELGALLRSMVHDRQHSDEQTFTMLDTLQQAMIRLLDRIDAIELAQATARIPAPGSHSLVPPALPPMTQPQVSEIQDFGAPEQSDAPLSMVPPPLTMPSAATADAPSADDTPLDKLRRDFIADAQRAKLRAIASEPLVSQPATVAAPARAPRGVQRPQAAPADPMAGTGRSGKQRLTALALCLVIAVSGAALIMKSRSKSPVAANPVAASESMPQANGQGVNAPAASVQNSETEIDVPAAPPLRNALPLTGNGDGFEVPASDGATVHAPASENDAGGPVGGQVLQNGYSGAGAEAYDVTPQGIVLQGNGRQPTAEELASMQAQQNVAMLSSRLGSNASRLSPADLMPEEVAKFTRASATSGAASPMAFQSEPASLSATQAAAAPSGRATAADWKSASQLSLPPATVGPLSLRLAAANGDPSAAFEVGARLAEGKGTTQDFAEAVVWYQKSAAQGFAQAQYRLGTLYERGLGVKKDPARAQMWYQRAAEQGHVKAMHNLAVLTAGRNSGNPDYTTASQWFQSAADYGLADSQFNLAVLHENGFGVAKSPVQAYKWYSLAGQGGDVEALRRRDALKVQLTTDERLQAEKDLAAFQPKRSIPLVNDPRAAGEDWKKRQES
jgi:localization factor PodJL